MPRSTFTHDILLLFAGPLVWAAHFIAIYGLMGVACARAAPGVRWWGVDWAGWTVVAMGLVSVAVLVLWLRSRPATTLAHNRRFLRLSSLALAGLAMLAIGWETLAVFLIPSCFASH